MCAFGHLQVSLSGDPNRLPLLSNKQLDNDAISSFAYSVNRPGSRRGRMPGKGRKQYDVPDSCIHGAEKMIRLRWWDRLVKILVPGWPLFVLLDPLLLGSEAGDLVDRDPWASLMSVLGHEAWHDKAWEGDWASAFQGAMSNALDFLRHQPSGMKCCPWPPNKDKEVHNMWESCKCRCRVDY